VRHLSSTIRLLLLLTAASCVCPLHAEGPALPRTPVLTVKEPLTPWTITPDARWTQLHVTKHVEGDVTLRLAHARLVDARPGRNVQLGVDRLRLCSTAPPPEACHDQAQTITSADQSIWLVVDPAFTSNGIFTGSIQLTTDPASDVTTHTVTIQQSTTEAQVLGALAILAGVTLAWGILHFGRNRVARNQALLPAALLRQRIHTLLLELSEAEGTIKAATGVDQKLENLRQQAGKLLPQLEEKFLDAGGFLPPRIPGITAASPQTAAYQTHLQRISQILDGAESILAVGVLPAAAKLRQVTTPADRDAIRKIIEEIDELAVALPTAAQALIPAIQALLDKFTAAARTRGADVAIAAGRDKPRTSLQLLAEIDAISLTFWAIWAILATLSGYLVLIAYDPGFGGSVDYVRCIFWGFGLPVAGQSLQQLTLGTVNTQLGVTVSR
jgi:hypothetical protein